jgi:hypothetical protein
MGSLLEYVVNAYMRTNCDTTTNNVYCFRWEAFHQITKLVVVSDICNFQNMIIACLLFWAFLYILGGSILALQARPMDWPCIWKGTCWTHGGYFPEMGCCGSVTTICPIMDALVPDTLYIRVN